MQEGKFWEFAECKLRRLIQGPIKHTYDGRFCENR